MNIITLKNQKICRESRISIGLNVHKHYLIAVGVDDDLNIVLPVRRVEFSYLETWMKKPITK